MGTQVCRLAVGNSRSVRRREAMQVEAAGPWRACTLGVRRRPRDAHSECGGDRGVHARSAGETAGCVQTVPSPSRAGAAQLQAGPATLTVTRFCYSPKEAKTDGSKSRCSH